MTDATDEAPRRTRSIPLASILAGGGIVAYAFLLRTHSALVAGALLALSMGIDYLVIKKQHPHSLLGDELAICEAVKLALIILYLLFAFQKITSPLVATCVSVAALGWGLLVTYMMVSTAADMIRCAAARRRVTGSLHELLTDKVLALTGVVIAFLHITYALAFALAFRDAFGGHHDLYAVPYGDTRELDPPHLPNGSMAEACETKDISGVRKFFFVESAAMVSCTAQLKDLAASMPRKAICEDGIEARIATFSSVAVNNCDQAPAAILQRRAALWNIRQLYELRDIFRHYAREPLPASYLIEVRGHANDTQLKNAPGVAYSSNYEISKQRADQVALLLQDAFREATKDLNAPAVRWLSYGVSNESSFLDAKPENWVDPLPLDQKLSVEVRVVPVSYSFEDRHLRAARSDPRPLDLTDYLYFTVYTITTTGYGDIIPTSSYAKFVVTIANLIELLFVVVLVNVIANTRLEATTRESEGEDDAQSG